MILGADPEVVPGSTHPQCIVDRQVEQHHPGRQFVGGGVIRHPIVREDRSGPEYQLRGDCGAVQPGHPEITASADCLPHQVRESSPSQHCVEGALPSLLRPSAPVQADEFGGKLVHVADLRAALDLDADSLRRPVQGAKSSAYLAGGDILPGGVPRVKPDEQALRALSDRRIEWRAIRGRQQRPCQKRILAQGPQHDFIPVGGAPGQGGQECLDDSVLMPGDSQRIHVVHAAGSGGAKHGPLKRPTPVGLPPEGEDAKRYPFLPRHEEVGVGNLRFHGSGRCRQPPLLENPVPGAPSLHPLPRVLDRPVGIGAGVNRHLDP